MSDPNRPKAWANILAKAWGPHFPVEVRQIALEYTQVRFPNEPIADIVQADVGGSFEGCLFYADKRSKWFIVYNPSISPARRINFTLAHELGHYLVHRELSTRFECSQQNVIGFGGEWDIEKEANAFASYLLMPLDDFRSQVEGQRMCLDLLEHCADRYDVTLTATILKWLEYTSERALLVVSRSMSILWSRSSNAAYKSGRYFRKGTAVPINSAASLPLSAEVDENEFEIPPGVWFPEAVREILVTSDRFDLNISLLILPRVSRSVWHAEESEPELTERLTIDMEGDSK